MIASFRSKALKRFFERNDARGIRPDWRDRVRGLLSQLDAAVEPAELVIPGSGFHPLTGDMAGRFALTVSRNHRLTFGWSGTDAIDLDLEDYHG